MVNIATDPAARVIALRRAPSSPLKLVVSDEEAGTLVALSRGAAGTRDCAVYALMARDGIGRPEAEKRLARHCSPTLREVDGDRVALHRVIGAIAAREDVEFREAFDRFQRWADVAGRKLERLDSREATIERETGGLRLERVLREGGIPSLFALSTGDDPLPWTTALDASRALPSDGGRVPFEGDWDVIAHELTDPERRKAAWLRAHAVGWVGDEDGFHQQRERWAADGYDLVSTFERRQSRPRSVGPPSFYGPVRAFDEAA